MTTIERAEARISRLKHAINAPDATGDKCIALDADALWRVICAKSTREEDER